MPRVAPLYRFIKMHYLETKMMRFDLSEDAAREQALSIWNKMTPMDKQRFKHRVHLFEIGELSPQMFNHYNRTESCDRGLVTAIAEGEVLDEAEAILKSDKKNILLLQVSESPIAPGYPEELTIIKFSLGYGIETFFHGVFDNQELAELNDDPTMTRKKLDLKVIGIRNDPMKTINLRQLARHVGQFVQDQKLFIQRSQMPSCHKVLQLLSLVETNMTLAVYPLEELVHFLVGRTMPLRDISNRLETIDLSPNTQLACDFHQKRYLADRCTLLNAINMMRRFAEIFARHRKYYGTAYFAVISRPRGEFFFGNITNKRKLSQMIEFDHDDVLKAPVSKSKGAPDL